MIRPSCPYCGSAHTMRRKLYPKLCFQCMDCERYFYGEESPAKILVFDIETLPMVMFAWRLGDETYDPDFIIRDWSTLSYSYKWLFHPESASNVMTPKEAIAGNDQRLVKEIWELFDQADIIIAHNGDNFDVPRMLTRFLYYGMKPPSPFLTIDTRKEAKRVFGFTSNKLAYLARYLNFHPKLHTDFSLWVRCSQGDKEALEYMRRYNEQDIFTLEDVYVAMRPYIHHPNMSLYMDIPTGVHVCPHCGARNVKWSSYHRTGARVYKACECPNCGAWGRDFRSFITTSTVRVRV